MRRTRLALAGLFFTFAFLIFNCAPARAAVGDAVASCSSVAAGATLDIQPGSGVEWFLHNIWFEYNVEIQRYDGTNTVAATQLLGPDYKPLSTRLTNGNRVRVKNLHGSSAKLICYDAVITM